MRDLIAHELAHVLQEAWGWDFRPDDHCDEEEHADLLMQAWGFDAYAMDEWDRVTV